MPENRDWFTKVDLTAKILTPVMIFALGTMYSCRQSKVDLEQKTMDRMVSLCKSLSSSSPSEQKIALALINQQKKNYPNLISDEILAVALPEVIEVATNSKNADVAEEAKRVAVDLSANTTLERTVKTSVENIQPRIYMHIPDENLRDDAKRIEGALEALNYSVPGIEKVRFDLANTQVRYFKAAEEQEAKQIADQIRSLGISDTKEIYIGGSEGSNAIRPRHYEVWFSLHAFSRRASPTPTPQ